MKYIIIPLLLLTIPAKAQYKYDTIKVGGKWWITRVDSTGRKDTIKQGHYIYPTGSFSTGKKTWKFKKNRRKKGL